MLYVNKFLHLVDGKFLAGSYRVKFDSNSLVSVTFIYRFSDKYYCKENVVLELIEK